MKRYEAPLHIGIHLVGTNGELSSDELVLLHQLYDGMSDKELLEPANIASLDELRVNGYLDIEWCFEELLGLPFVDSVSRRDRTAEAKGIGSKNYHVALARFTDTSNLKEARRLLWFLATQHAVHDPTDQELMGEFDELAKAVQRAAKLAPANQRKVEKEIWEAMMDE